MNTKQKSKKYYKSGRIKADTCDTVNCVNKCTEDSIYCGTCEYHRYYTVWSRKFAAQKRDQQAEY